MVTENKDMGKKDRYLPGFSNHFSTEAMAGALPQRQNSPQRVGLITGEYDAKAGGFAPGGASLHNQISAHGLDRASYDKTVSAGLMPHKIENIMAFMFESRHVFQPTRWTMDTALLQPDHDEAWGGFLKAQVPQ